MNIFIFGNASFKSDIHKVFEHSNIKFRLSDSDSIQEIRTLIELRTTIKNYPKDIFLIDDAKIFRKNSLNEKIKFLKPRGAIEEEFIKKYGVEEIKIDSLEDLPKHIIQKLEESNSSNIDDDYHNAGDDLDIQESIIDIVDEAYNNENLTNIDKIDNIDEENDKIQLDDELSSLLISEEEVSDNVQEEIKEELEEDSIIEENINSEDKLDSEDEKEIIKGEGEDMSDEFSELDNINESDILAALDGLEDVDINSIAPAKTEAQSSQESQSNIGVEVGSSNVNEIAALITSLLNNKTLEITIKVKA